jgi:hypothetical protein
MVKFEYFLQISRDNCEICVLGYFICNLLAALYRLIVQSLTNGQRISHFRAAAGNLPIRPLWWQHRCTEQTLPSINFSAFKITKAMASEARKVGRML